MLLLAFIWAAQTGRNRRADLLVFVWRHLRPRLAITKVQTSTGASNSGISGLSTTFGSTITSGNAVVLYFWLVSTSVNSVTDDKNNTYIRCASAANSGPICYIYVCTNITNSPKTISVFLGGTGILNLVAEEVSGLASIASTADLDISGTNVGFNSTPSVSVTTANNNDYLAAVATSSATWTPATPAGWSSLYSFTSIASGSPGQAIDQIVSSTGTYNPTWNSTSANWAAAQVAFKGASSVAPDEAFTSFTGRFREVKYQPIGSALVQNPAQDLSTTPEATGLYTHPSQVVGRYREAVYPGVRTHKLQRHAGASTVQIDQPSQTVGHFREIVYPAAAAMALQKTGQDFSIAEPYTTSVVGVFRLPPRAGDPQRLYQCAATDAPPVAADSPSWKPTRYVTHDFTQVARSSYRFYQSTNFMAPLPQSRIVVVNWAQGNTMKAIPWAFTA